LMSEPWLRLGLVFFVTMLVLLYQRHRLHGKQAFAAGAILAFAFLLRAESITVLVGWVLFLLFADFVVGKRQPGTRKALAVVVFALGVVAVFAPWIGRSVVLTSHFPPSHSFYRTPWFFWYQIRAPLSPEYRQDVFSPTSWLPVDTPLTSGKVVAARSFAAEPLMASRGHGDEETSAYGPIIKGISVLFVRNGLASILALPPTVEIAPLGDTLKASPFWRTKRLFSLRWPMSAWVMLALNLAFLAVGMVTLWQHSEESRLLLLVTLFIWGGYLLTVAIPRSSGGRYIVPANWVPLLFYAVGLYRGVKWLVRRLWGGEVQQVLGVALPADVLTTLSRQTRGWVAVVVGLSWWIVALEFGAAGWMAHRGQAQPPRRQPASQDEVLHRLDALKVWDEVPWTRAAVQTALQSGELKAQWGLAYHPLYLAPGTQCEDMCGFQLIEHPTLYFNSIFAWGHGFFYVEIPPGAQAQLERMDNGDEALFLYCPKTQDWGNMHHWQVVLLITVPEEGAPVILASPAASPAEVCAP